MVKRNALDVPVIGVAKSGWTLEQLRERAKDSIAKHGGGIDDEAFQRLCEQLQYIDGDYKDPKTYEQIRTQLGDAQLPTHYLAIPPSMFPVVVQGLGQVGRAKNARVIVEKPFGRDLLSARKLNDTLHSVFPEENIYRIDHYLGKEAVENLLIFRFANSFLSPSGTAITSTACRSRWRSRSASRAAASSTRRRAPSATWCRTTCCRWSPSWRWSRPPACTLTRCATSR